MQICPNSTTLHKIGTNKVLLFKVMGLKYTKFVSWVAVKNNNIKDGSVFLFNPTGTILAHLELRRKS